MNQVEQGRPVWQEKRGPRYGNLRRQVAELKVRSHRNDRACFKAQTLKEF
jgi:acetyl-CoA acetyltransferase